MDKQRILGLDLGTNSLGWGLVEHLENEEYRLLDEGVCVFQEGVAREKNIEKPATQDRTASRGQRRHYFRRKLRKIGLLKVLMKYDLCPKLTDEELELWRNEGKYPANEEFIEWQKTNDNEGKNPYYSRYRATNEELDLDKEQDRHDLGRALYHLSQRRGFLSNRKDSSKDDETGKVKESIKDLTEEMKEAGCKYLGEYFYKIYGSGKKIRNHYTSRLAHTEAEFDGIAAKQGLPEEMTRALKKEIFFQRPLKSQKQNVGRCPFEKKKSRCPVSHPRFEEYRMLQTINNIRIKDPMGEWRELNDTEKSSIIPLFLRKSKENFDFEDIAKALTGKNKYSCRGENKAGLTEFNYRKDQPISGSPFTSQLKNLFGEDWETTLKSIYLKSDGKNDEQIINDIWHAIWSAETNEQLSEWGRKNLQLSEEEAVKFGEIKTKQDYAKLSLNAINKILPYLRAGYRYDEAVFLANLKKAVERDILADPRKLSDAERGVAEELVDFNQNPLNKGKTKMQVVREFLIENGYSTPSLADHLYHPSQIETYPKQLPDENGTYQLGSPVTKSVKNPMAMRALHRLRALVNKLLRDGEIDQNTKIHIEFARELNDANHRKAIEQEQRENHKKREEYSKQIASYFKEIGLAAEPSDDDILKYQLWEEQKHICLYTGNQISISDFLGSNPRYDIEHTVPRSLGGDDSQMNKTLCDARFNRDVKRAKLPAQLSNHNEIMARIDGLGWRETIADLHSQINRATRRAKAATTKEDKDRAITQRNYLKSRLAYWEGKLKRFEITEVTEGFMNRQKSDTSIINRYGKEFLQSVFPKVYVVKGSTTAEFRKMWGLQEEYSKKERVNHSHHAIDAIVIACIGKGEYDRWARYVAANERHKWLNDVRPNIEKPWPTFTQDIKKLSEHLMISHFTPDNLSKQTKRLIAKGKKKSENEGKRYIQGEGARGSLHADTFYGAVKKDGEIKYVVRKKLESLQESDVTKIVDPAVKEKIEAAIREVGFKKAVNPAEHTIWMNQEKGVKINKVRVFTPNVTRPIFLKKHRDQSKHEHKRYYHVGNDGNYCMAIYEGKDSKGKPKRTFNLISNLEAAKYYTGKTGRSQLVPSMDENGYELIVLLKRGKMVLLYENSPEELKECSQEELVRRLYKVIGISAEENRSHITLKHHQESRKNADLNMKKGKWKIGEEIRPIIIMSNNQFDGLIEGKDFELGVDGKIRFKG